MTSACDGGGQSQYDKTVHIRQGTPVPIEGRGLPADVDTIFWKRYVDDVLMVVPADQVDGMLAHINSINQNILFTSEREGHVIPFFDVTILHNDDGSLYQSLL